MNDALSPNTQAILLLTAPLILGRGRRSSDKPLSTAEYNRLAGRLRALDRQPADLPGDGARELIEECREVDPKDPKYPDRLRRLLGRGVLLSQALGRWRARDLWVMSRADPEYPQRMRRLREQAPPVLYGCGDRAALDSGGLAVVGSRNVERDLITYTEEVGRQAAEAECTLVSGGARGIDQAAMRGALDAGGTVACVLADGLERAATRREHRDAVMDDRLVLICPYDPAAGFLVGHAMQRNKLIYALSDAALVVSAEFQKGGTWAGAVEQLEKHRFVSVYVRTTGERGLDALQERGARRWPDPDSPEAIVALLDAPPPEAPAPGPASPLRETPSDREPVDDAPPAEAATPKPVVEPRVESSSSSAEALFAFVRDRLLPHLDEPRTEKDIAEELGVQRNQARAWLKRLLDDGAIEKLKGGRYECVRAARPLLPLSGTQDAEPR